jgi:hypothetical protein
VAAVRRALDELHAHPARLRPLAATDTSWSSGWQRVSEDPAPFLGLGLTSDRWLEAALPALMGASAALRLQGDQVVHLDVRSDNLCFVPRGAVLVDWNCPSLRRAARPRERSVACPGLPPRAVPVRKGVVVAAEDRLAHPPAPRRGQDWHPGRRHRPAPK